MPLALDLYDSDVERAIRGLGGGARQVLGIAVAARDGALSARALVAGEFEAALPVSVFAIVEG